jgi:hypothetical protein
MVSNEHSEVMNSRPECHRSDVSFSVGYVIPMCLIPAALTLILLRFSPVNLLLFGRGQLEVQM